MVCLNDRADPLILLDDLDKARRSHNADLIAPLRSLLEPLSASKVTDISTGVKFDASHIFCGGERIDEGVDVVVLAGDIAEGVQGIRWARETFIMKEIAYVAVNHEHHDRHWETLHKDMRSIAENIGVHFLDEDSVALFGVRFLDVTLWTDPMPVPSSAPASWPSRLSGWTKWASLSGLKPSTVSVKLTRSRSRSRSR